MKNTTAFAEQIESATTALLNAISSEGFQRKDHLAAAGRSLGRAMNASYTAETGKLVDALALIYGDMVTNPPEED